MSSEDAYVDTPIRVAKALSLYIEQFNLPDRIIFHTEKWDTQRIHEVFDSAPHNSPIYNHTIEVFIQKTRERLREIRAIVGDSVDVGLRTAAWARKGGDLLKGLNDAVRTIAAEDKLTLYDLDADVWSTVGFNYTQESFVFRDWLHPRMYYLAGAVEKILGRRYTPYLTLSPSTWSHAEQLKEFYISSTHPTWSVPLIRSPSYPEVFYYHKHTATRHAIPHPNFYHVLRFGPADVMNVTDDVMASIPLGSRIPSQLFEEGSVINSTSSQHLYFVIRADEYSNAATGLLRRELPSDEAAHVLVRSPSQWVHLDESTHHWMNLLSNPMGSDIRDVFAPDTLLRLHSSREIFLLRNRSLHSVPNMQAFGRLGKDLSDVVVLKDEELFRAIPVGDPFE